MSDKERSYYYYDYLRNKSPYYYDLLYTELEKRVFYYGDHFARSYEANHKFSFYKQIVLEVILFIFNKIRFAFRPAGSNSILSHCYFDFRDKLIKAGYTNYSVPWMVNLQPSIVSFRSLLKIQLFKIQLQTSTFNHLISPSFLSQIPAIEKIVESALTKRKIIGVFLSSDMGFFERLIVSIAKRNNVKTFIMMHGAAPRYANTELDSRTDYYIVFGNLYKQKYIECGYEKSKFIVAGHPLYSFQHNNIQENLRFDFSNIIIISKTIPGQHLQIPASSRGRIRDSMRLSDRGNSVLYLMLIQEVLIKFDISKVKLRLHPSENRKWYAKFIDTEFFQFDTEDLHSSLTSASLVIGPTSSTFIDAIFHNVNYLIFEPLYNEGVDILNQGVGHPFDGSDNRVPVANDSAQLEQILLSKLKIDTKIASEFISSDFKLSDIEALLAN